MSRLRALLVSLAVLVTGICSATAHASLGIHFSSQGPITATGRLTFGSSTICTSA